MPWRALSAILSLGLVLAPATAARSAEAPPARVFVLDPEGLSLTSVALGTGEVLGKATLLGRPIWGLMSPEGSRLVVLDPGPGKLTHPTGKSWATVIDTWTLGVIARTELGWTVDTGDRLAFGPDGRRLTLSCLGYRSQKPEEALPRELMNLDLETGRITGRVEVERALDHLLRLDDGRAVLFSGREAAKNRPPLPAQLRFVDLATLQVQSTLSLEGDPGRPVLSPDGKHLYLLEHGKPDKKPEKNINGRVQVFSTDGREHVVNLDAGRDPRGLVVDEEGNQVFVLSEGEPSKEKKDEIPGLLRVIRGAEVAATVPVGEEPLFLRTSPDRERLYVVSEKTLTAIDLPALSRLGTSELKPAGISLLAEQSGKSTVKELALSTDGKRAYALYAQSSNLGILDLEGRKLVASISTGRGGVKFGKFLAAVAAIAASYSAGASASGSSFFFYQVYTVAPANTTLALTEDEKHVYVLNTHSNDVTIVDAETHEVVAKIGVGGSANRLELLPGGAFVAVTTGADTLHLIETKSHRKTGELPDGGNYVFAPGKRHAAAIGKGVVYCLEGATLKTLGKATGFRKPTQLLFEPEPPPPATPEPPPEPPSPETPTPPGRALLEQLVDQHAPAGNGGLRGGSARRS